MEIVKGVLILLHLAGFAVVLGSTLTQLPRVKEKAAVVSEGVFHGIAVMFITGLVMVIVNIAIGEPVDVFKFLVKLAVLIVLSLVALFNRRTLGVSRGVLWTIAGLAVLNVVLAVLW